MRSQWSDVLGTLLLPLEDVVPAVERPPACVYAWCSKCWSLCFQLRNAPSSHLRRIDLSVSYYVVVRFVQTNSEPPCAGVHLAEENADLRSA